MANGATAVHLPVAIASSLAVAEWKHSPTLAAVDMSPDDVCRTSVVPQSLSFQRIAAK